MSHQTALLVIDAQVSILDDSNAYRAPETLVRIADLLDRARTAGTPVIFIQHDHDRYEPMMPGAPGWQIHPAVAPQPGETVVRKRAADAFFGTELRAKLDDRAVTRVVVTGCETQYCVDATVRRALSLDYDVVLAADGHTTSSFDDGGLTPAQIIAHHNAVLANLPHPTREIQVRPAAEIEFS